MEARERKAHGGPSAILVFFFAFVLYNLNLRVIHTDDSLPTRLLPFCLVLNHSFSTDGWIEPYLSRPKGPSGIYFASRVNGHWVSNLPVATPVALVPLYLVPGWWLAGHPCGDVTGAAVRAALVNIMEKLSASLIAALSVSVLYLALLRVASPSLSLTFSAIYGLASSTWSIDSQALWQHGLSELAFALLLWTLLGENHGRRGALEAGFCAALAAASRPADAVVGLGLLLYFLIHDRDNLPAFMAPLLAVGSLVVSYNVHFFGGVLGGYHNACIAFGLRRTGDAFQGSLLRGLVGFTLSPARGWLVFMPWTVFSVWGAARAWKEGSPKWIRYLSLSMAALLLVHARFNYWWGGWSYGPRYLSELMPFVIFFLLPVVQSLQRSHWLRTSFALAVFWAFALQTVGAFYYPNGRWDSIPANVDTSPQRLWDWADTPFARSFRAGPASPQLLYEGALVLMASRTKSTRPAQSASPSPCQSSPRAVFHPAAP